MRIKLCIFVLVCYWIVLLGSTFNAYADPINISYREAVMKHVTINEGYRNDVYIDSTGNKSSYW